ncbi:Curlin associated repeat-containing protein [Methylobacterium sp. 174MFSha1.1]|uniref:hypothetical protein n=1 Tax=Methylobacterium sp. 174MFSha1.1 TaxID=1502749 RepID=UPI0008E96F96|nr:hypothetical protein [Methylobacterium sp. 174MFSha1.1]SFV03669.1 Curlin associated repeat-containing protein [Methylobacterium sp. 174MFSha1.1]
MSKSVLLGSVALFVVAFAGTASAQQAISPVLSSAPTVNEAIVVQRGGTNKATIDQTIGQNNKAGYLNNTIDLSAANITENNGNGAFTNVNSVLQNGNNNELNIIQPGSNNSVVTSSGNYFRDTFIFNPTSGGSFQRGDGNKVYVNQGGGNGVAQFQQRGDGNTGSIITEANANNTYAGLFQFGDSNTAQIRQNSTAINAYAVVVQQGNNNSGAIEQSGTYNYAGLLQIGSYNTAGITQFGTAGVGAGGYQYGVGNSASVLQNGLSSSNALFAQAGNNNSVTIRQR